MTNAPAVGQLYGMPNDMRYAFSDFERERINAQGVVQFAPSDALTLTLDYTFANNEITENRGEQTIWLQRNNSFTDLTFDTNEAVATPVFLRDLVGGKDFGFEQQRNEQKNELNSIGFNAAWRVTDNFTLGLDAHNSKSKSLPNDPDRARRQCHVLQLRRHELREQHVHGRLQSGVHIQQRPADHGAHLLPHAGGRGGEHERHHECRFHAPASLARRCCASGPSNRSPR